MDTPARAPGGRLSGWKEIAAHFGRTVRTVQRWERELGLPVHRLSTGKGETVFALLDELDRWEAHVTVPRPGPESVIPPGSGSHDPDGHGYADAGAIGHGDEGGNGDATGGASAEWPAPAPAKPVRVGRSRRSAFIIGGALVLIAAASLVAMWFLSGRPRGVPSAFERQGRDLIVSDQAGRPLWHWRVPFELNERHYVESSLHRRETVAFADLEGDGSVETIVAAVGVAFENSAVYVFEQDGRVRFAWKNQARKRFGDITYSPPWVVGQIAVRRPAGGRPELWVSTVHAPWFPSSLVRLDAAGRVTGEYWHPGSIASVVPVRLGGRDVFLVGACNNEFRTAGLAVVDPAVSSTAPTVEDYYRCAGCPPAGPIRYLLFPRTTIAREFDAVSYIPDIAVDAAGQVVVSVEHLGFPLDAESGAVSAQVHYILNKDLVPVSAELGDSYVRAYRMFQAEGRFSEPLARDDQREVWPLREWNGSEFVPLPVPDPRG